MKRVLTLSVVLLLTACGSKFTKTELESDRITPSKRIAIIPANLPEKLSVEVFDNKIGFLGTAGKITVIKGQDTKRRKFTESVKELGYEHRADIRDNLLACFAEAGIMAERIDYRRKKDNILEAVPPGKLEKKYSGNLDGYDYLLDVAVSYVGYASGGLTADYLPALHVAVRIVDTASLEHVYESRIQYNPNDIDGDELVIEANSDYAFDNFDALIADPERATEGLAGAIRSVIQTLITDIDADWECNGI